MSRTDSSAVPFRLFNDFLSYTLFVVIDEMALSILTAGVLMAIYFFYSLTLRDLSHLYMRVFMIFKTFPPLI